MKKFNLIPELEEAVRKTNDAMGDIVQGEISEEYPKILLDRIHEIIERYYICGRDVRSCYFHTHLGTLTHKK